MKGFYFLKYCSRKRSIKHLQIFSTHDLDSKKLLLYVALLIFPMYLHSTSHYILLKLTKALQFDGIIVCPLLTVAFITRLSVQTEAIFADFLSKKQAFICIYGGKMEKYLERGVIWGFSVKQKSLTNIGQVRYYNIYITKSLKNTAISNS